MEVASEKREFDIHTDLSPNALDNAVKAARRGDWIIYHLGITANGPHCREAMSMSMQKRVSLTQRRVATTGDRRFEYIAEKL